VTLATCRGWERFVSEQPPYNLLDRTIEIELIWICQRHGIAVNPWAPLATGLLSGQYEAGQEPPATSRRAKGGLPDSRFTPAALDRVEQLRSLAQEAGVSPAVYALAWVLNRPGITSPVIGVRTIEHLRTIVKATDITFSADDHARIDAIVPPGTAVADYYDVNVYAPLRQKPAEEPNA
jgi:1-deoxyxylulose-5-phosphate synthase